MDPQRLVQLLSASLDGSDAAARRAAEDVLQAAARQPGFAPLLAQATLEGGLPLPLRQLAAVLLKNTCARHWQEGERGFEPPQVRVPPRGCFSPLQARAFTPCGPAPGRLPWWPWPPVPRFRAAPNPAPIPPRAPRAAPRRAAAPRRRAAAGCRQGARPRGAARGARGAGIQDPHRRGRGHSGDLQFRRRLGLAGPRGHAGRRDPAALGRQPRCGAGRPPPPAPAAPGMGQPPSGKAPASAPQPPRSTRRLPLPPPARPPPGPH
jgi:hypothetical protein